jgi:predicted O-methyltransferase YrrM
MTQYFSHDWFSIHIPQWEKDLREFVGLPNLNFLEVGCFEGKGSCWLLENILTHPSSRLICVDTFDFAGQHLQLDASSMESTFDNNILDTGRGSCVEKKVGFSQEILRVLPLYYFDFIYIDGSHLAPHVLEDAILSWRLLKPGGILTFDDYEWDSAPLAIERPKIAIDSFLQCFQGQYDLIYKVGQVTMRKK